VQLGQLCVYGVTESASQASGKSPEPVFRPPLASGRRRCMALGLAEGKVEDHADRQSRLDGQVRVRALSARFPAGRNSPGVDCIFGKPDGEVPTAVEACFVPRPVAYPYRDLVCLYWLRFGYFIVDDSGSGMASPYHSAKPRAMHQRHPAPLQKNDELSLKRVGLR
jgi:hypothetical protein